jgi:hypothetical protein
MLGHKASDFSFWILPWQVIAMVNTKYMLKRGFRITSSFAVVFEYLYVELPIVSSPNA